MWLSVWSEVQIVCTWSSWCHCIPKPPSSLASFKSRPILPFRYRLTPVVLEKRPLNGSCCTTCCYTVHQLTRFRLSQRIARSVCGSRASVLFSVVGKDVRIQLCIVYVCLMVGLCMWDGASIHRQMRFSVLSPILLLYYTRCSKSDWHQTDGGNSVNSRSIFNFFFHVRFSSKFAATYLLEISKMCVFLLKIPPHLICVATLPCETLPSENERQSQTNALINENYRAVAGQ